MLKQTIQVTFVRMVNFSSMFQSTFNKINSSCIIFFYIYRRRNRNCPRSESESNGDHWCCDVKTKNVTQWDLIWWPCDEIEALQEENGGENPPDDQIAWSEHSRKRRSGDHG